jgi:hypothetical protein
MSLSGETQRYSRGNLDDLAIAMTLTKGGIGSVTLHGASVCVTSLDKPSDPEYVGLLGIAQVKIDDKKSAGKSPCYEIIGPWDGKISYNLPPGASSIWSCHVEVPAEKTCTIQVVIVGRQPWQWGRRQWRASLISLPVSAFRD